MQGAVDPRRWWILAAVGVGTFLNVLDNSMLNVSLPTITRELRRNENGQRKYNPNRAYRLAHERHKFKRKYRIDNATWAMVEKRNAFLGHFAR